MHKSRAQPFALLLHGVSVAIHLLDFLQRAPELRWAARRTWFDMYPGRGATFIRRYSVVPHQASDAGDEDRAQQPSGDDLQP
jgi:hypothetical protein